MDQCAPHAAWYRGATKAEARDNAPFEAPLEARGKQGEETQRARRFRRGTPVSRRSISDTGSLRRLPPRVQRPDRDTPPPAFWKKRLQADENRGSEYGKESKEQARGGKSLRERNLRQKHRNSAGERAEAAKTHWAA